MTPNELRERILSDHAQLRRALADLEELSHAALDRGATGREELRRAGEHFLFQLEEHMRHEDDQLVPLLRTIDAWGPERAHLVEEDHRAQRAQMRVYLDALRRRDAPRAELADLLLEIASWLRRDMDDEEEVTLRPDVLRDDVVGIDVEAG
ncbi:MAG: hemerythrin domain-containing protein [Myxococcota bacterium]|nr:hemerythrin domain-containing protein [Myxococcales bacterium]